MKKEISVLQTEVNAEGGSRSQEGSSAKTETTFGTFMESTKRFLFGDPNRKESNLDDYADVSTEMPSHTDPED